MRKSLNKHAVGHAHKILKLINDNQMINKITHQTADLDFITRRLLRKVEVFLFLHTLFNFVFAPTHLNTHRNIFW